MEVKQHIFVVEHCKLLVRVQFINEVDGSLTIRSLDDQRVDSSVLSKQITKGIANLQSQVKLGHPAAIL